MSETDTQRRERYRHELSMKRAENPHVGISIFVGVVFLILSNMMTCIESAENTEIECLQGKIKLDEVFKKHNRRNGGPSAD